MCKHIFEVILARICALKIFFFIKKNNLFSESLIMDRLFFSRKREEVLCVPLNNNHLLNFLQDKVISVFCLTVLLSFDNKIDNNEITFLSFFPIFCMFLKSEMGAAYQKQIPEVLFYLRHQL